MPAIGTYPTTDLRRAVNARRLGTFPALPGWTYAGREIAAVAFDRFQIVRYLDETGAAFATFQDRAPIDD
jgi:hypothetical protein